MAKTTCPRCGIVGYPHKCPHVSKERSKYRNNRDDAKIYADSRWDKVRAEVIEECMNICLWSFYVDGTIRTVGCVHHIIEVLQDKGQAYDKDNLIGLDKSVHIYIHKLYKTIYKDNVIRLLKQLKDYYNNNGLHMEDLGKFKNVVKEWTD